tara:strand:- start:1833 stop:2999 length:1167 start_codon:yes stop_codon:yes gene_type:complete
MPGHTTQYGNFFEFHKEDIFRNRIKTYPKYEIFIYSGTHYLNDENQSKENANTPSGHINLHDLNVNRAAHASAGDSQLIHPFITKQGSFINFKTISTDKFNLDFSLGSTLTGTYPMTSAIHIERFGTAFSGRKKRVLNSLRSTLDFYTPLSPRYAFSSSFGEKASGSLNLISVPSIFYGSSIKKGSVFLKYYVTGTLLAEASDINRNGDLIQTTGSTTGHVIGSVLYNEGFLLLTSSAALSSHTEQYVSGNVNFFTASWQHFAPSASYNSTASSYSVAFNGTNYIDTITMFAQAKENFLNFSTNPTFLSGSKFAFTSSDIYHEDSQLKIKNIVSSSYKNYTSSFKPVTYISKIGIYDKDKNLIAVAGLANPVRKLEERSYTFKLKLDI